MSYVIVLNPDYTIDVKGIDDDRPNLYELKSLAGCLFIDVVPAKSMGDKLRLVVDDEGLMNDKPYNHLATSLYGSAIAGKAVVVQIGGDEGEELHGFNLETASKLADYIRDMWG